MTKINRGETRSLRRNVGRKLSVKTEKAESLVLRGPMMRRNKKVAEETEMIVGDDKEIPAGQTRTKSTNSARKRWR